MALEIYEITCTGTGVSGSGPFVNVFHVHTVDTPVNTSAIATAFKNFYTSIASIYSSNMTLSVPSKVLHLGTPPDIMPVSPFTVSGSGGSSMDPPQIAAVVTWRTPFAGRSYRGRTYLGPLHGNSSVAGIFGSSITTPIQTAATALITAIGSNSGHFMSVLSRYHGVDDKGNPIKRPVPLPAAVESAVARTTAYTQRRRQVR